MKTKKGFMLKDVKSYEDLAHSDKPESLERYKKKKFKKRQCAIIDLDNQKLLNILEASI